MRPLIVLVAALAAVIVPATARAAAPTGACPGVTVARNTFTTAGPGGLYWLENMGFDGRGGMWVSELAMNKLVRYGANAQPGATLGVANPGASVLGPGGRMYVAFGDGFSGAAGVVSFDPASAHPVAKPYASGLKMANGMAFDAAGNLYVADTINNLVAKITPGGRVTPSFVSAKGADGVLVIGTTLYVTEFTDANSTILRVPLGDPGAATPVTELSPGGVDPKLIDDLTLGPDGRLYVASNTGELIRVDPVGGASCVVASGLPMVDSVRFARAFAPYGVADAFLTSQTGVLVHLRISGVTPKPKPKPKPRIRLRARPRRVLVGHRVRLSVASSSPACRKGVRVGRRVIGRRTSVRFRRAGRHVLVAHKKGCRSARATVEVRRR